ncbi:MAG: HEPN domain-containing protein [Chitinispirillales bacterium]|jgi:uncharacterized protein (UPF0332 family)|nr:HEPN domain-containing protein [Chitinispirillales bacterium]
MPLDADLDHAPEDFARYRIDRARLCLQDAKTPGVSFENAANRSYYCIFNAMRAVLSLDQFDSKRHSGVISVFRKGYIRTGVFPVEFSSIIDKAFDIRLESDYEAFYIVSKADVAAQVENAEVFLAAVEKYVSERIKHT